MRHALNPVHAGLLRGLRAMLRRDALLANWLEPAAGGLPGLVVEDFDCVPWASLNFAGFRHRLMLRLTGEAAAVMAARARLEALLVEPELTTAGHVLIEMAVEAAEEAALPDGRVVLGLEIAALTIAE
ncbi:hypothetical protein [Sandaracinobacteroides saxicola]|uniref:DUF3168 domain-containing protein n=1 Tax=Sandaracinobacteroides saxicola TaxID=2759707 RepID=A0A7G5IJX4_9SPHN|nr:hypothetical protein [Sandaracinobacteroides saxicola]QMW23666.1 hypothetical protein H3309_04020 [Sandaracinobacteroides saxicola]